MMNKKQILVVALVLVIITAGILQYTYGRTGFSSQKDTDERLGEAVYVDNINGEIKDLSQSVVGQEAHGEAGEITPEEDYFIQAKLEREAIRSKQKEELQGLTAGHDPESENTPKAQEEYLNLIRRTEIEATIESLAKQRGFTDVVALYGVNGSVDLVVRAESLSQDQTAQLSDIVIRHAGVEMTDIHIRNMK